MAYQVSRQIDSNLSKEMCNSFNLIPTNFTQVQPTQLLCRFWGKDHFTNLVTSSLFFLLLKIVAITYYPKILLPTSSKPQTRISCLLLVFSDHLGRLPLGDVSMKYHLHSNSHTCTHTCTFAMQDVFLHMRTCISSLIGKYSLRRVHAYVDVCF